MIGDFLQKQGLKRTYAQLVEEAKLETKDAGPIGLQMENAVTNGDWPTLLTLLENNSFKDSDKAFEAVYAHMIMELVVMEENHLARQILDEQKTLLVPNWY